MISKSKKILMVAGEVSGDLWGSLLAKALLQIDPDLKIFGAGLDKMRQAGISLLLPPEKLIQLSVVGTLENIGKVPALFRLRRLILNSVQQERPRLVILIDFPGFNLNLAKKLQRFNVPLVYYSPPQTWLWG
ncbi:MAG: lipid-A-disaccharide synthase, partial [bacterium]|nr:lipid-A-disaccharide synthase [bacterium]